MIEDAPNIDGRPCPYTDKLVRVKYVPEFNRSEPNPATEYFRCFAKWK